jgi:3-oxoacyl-[acyl-carrier-protein] synthase II
MLAGATGTRVHPLKAVHAALSEELADAQPPGRAARPFDRDRTGMVLGEGAGAVVLEELSHARRRGAVIYAEVVGAGSASAADRNRVARRDAAMAAALRAALRESGDPPEAVGHVHAHGLATRSCDVEEARAIRAVFGERNPGVPVTAAKSYFGNLGAGSGAVELVASTLSLLRGRLFPILNFETPDPECPVAAVQSVEAPAGGSFLNVNVTPQGQASCIMVRRWRNEG